MHVVLVLIQPLHIESQGEQVFPVRKKLIGHDVHYVGETRQFWQGRLHGKQT